VTFRDRIDGALGDPATLEAIYGDALAAGQAAAFTSAMEAAYAASPDNPLLGAWHYRLAAQTPRQGDRAISWPAAIGLAIANGLVFWGLSAEQLVIEVGRQGAVPILAFLWAPISAAFVMAFLAVGGRRRATLAGLLALAAIGLGLYPLWARTLIGDDMLAEHYVLLAILHLTLLAWSATGLFVLVGRTGTDDRFAFLTRSLHVFVMAGLLAIAGAIFVAVTVGLFAALSITLPSEVVRLLVAGGGGLIPVIAVAIVYDPSMPPAEQPLDDGLGRVIVTLMRLLLPLTLIVLVIYVALIPFRFWEPFQDRDVLLIYNVTIFAILALLVGAAPSPGDTLGPAMRRWLPWLLVSIEVLAILLSVYELAAIAYRTLDGGLTVNRLAILGWNLVNAAILGGLVVGQARAGRDGWAGSMRRTLGRGMPLYAAWALFVVVAMPWLFR
jgi:hypothetical protein